MSIFKRQPGCPCCCDCDCDLFSDDFSTDTIADYDQAAGSWSISGGQLQTSSSNARIMYGTQRATPNHSVAVYCDHATDGDVSRIYVGWADANNHVYVEFTRSGLGVTAAVHEVVGGVDTELDVAAGAYPYAASYGVCLHDGIVSTSYAIGTSEPRTLTSSRLGAVAVSDQDALGTGFGLGTGAIGGTISFDNLSLKQLCSTCPNCLAPQCLAGTEPNECTVTFDGVVYDNCDECNEWNTNTYILSPDFVGVPEQSFLLDSGLPCSGYGNDYISIEVELVCQNTDEVLLRFRIRIQDDPFTGEEKYEVNLTHTIATGAECCKIDCLSEVKNLAVSLETSPDGHNCDWDNATAYITFSRS